MTLPDSAFSEDEKARVEAEIRAAFDSYETALMTNDVDSMMALFWDSSETVRLTAEGGAYGAEEIAAFRGKRDVSDIARILTRVEITVLSNDFGYANAEYKRTKSGRKGAQSHVWIRTVDGWKIASAHVSLSNK